MTTLKENAPKEEHAYTPGLKVKRAMTLYKTRQIPIPGEVYVKEGDIVDYDTIIARTYVSGDPEIIKVAALLGFASNPKDLPVYMLKKVGDKVSKDERIAGYSTLFGLLKKWVTSPVDGTVDTISNITGQVVIRGAPIPVAVKAYIPGKVAQILPNIGAIVATNAAFIQGIFGIGGETHGKVKIAVDSPGDELTPDQITTEDKGTVLICGSLATLEVFKKAAEVGVSCLVSGGVRYQDISTLIGEAIGVAITGQEEVGLTYIATEGFGKMRMSQRTFDLLKQFEGHLASVNGATQIRAGVMRPEIIIAHEESFDQTSDDSLAGGMIPGTYVRIIREPFFGAICKVVNLPVELQQVETRSYVRVVEVELDDGRIVTVPRANVEIIEE